MSHDPTKCNDKRAQCIIGSFWTCPSCDAPRQSPGKEKAQEEIISPWAGIFPVTTNTGMTLATSEYKCQVCGDQDYYFIDLVANGQFCHCGGSLQKLP